MSNIATQRKLVEQLRSEARTKRTPASTSLQDMIRYCDDNRNVDFLLIGFASEKANPFKEKSSCLIL
ncbi:unnamed protein product [Gordionus sp. m RMFG-2023]